MRVRPWWFDGSSSGTEGARCAASAGSLRLRFSFAFALFTAAGGCGCGWGEDVDLFGLLLGGDGSPLPPLSSHSSSEVVDSPYETRMTGWVHPPETDPQI